MLLINSPDTDDIAISTTYHHKPIILLHQVCHRESMQWSACVLRLLEDEEVEKTQATFYLKPQPYSLMGKATDLHSGGRGLESRWWTDFFFEYRCFLQTHFLEFSFDNTVTWHSKHATKWDLGKIKRTSSGNWNMLIANGYLLLFVLYSALKALV